MNNQCVFCNIAKKQMPSFTIYEDDKVLAFLDINPITDGHVLLITKEHYPVFQMVPSEIMPNISKAIKKISNVMKTTLGASGTNVFIANGQAAGQALFHTAIHIIPRYNNDDILAFFIPSEKSDKSELENLKKIFLEQIQKLTKKQEGKNLESQLTNKFN